MVSELWIVRCSMDYGECAYEIVCEDEATAEREEKRAERDGDGMYSCYKKPLTLGEDGVYHG